MKYERQVNEESISSVGSNGIGFCGAGWLRQSDYLDTTQGQFLMVDVLEWAYKNGLEQPTDQRQWGIVTRALKRFGVITNIGIHYPAHAHGAHVSMWVLA